MNSEPIGIFDSGIGGLTVFKEIAEKLPAENILYVGDTARLPYGEKSAASVRGYAEELSHFLVERGAKLIVIACHTASALALPDLQEKIPIPILGVVDVGVAAAIAASTHKQIGVIATRTTIESSIYQKALCQALPTSSITALACPLLVPLVEEALWNHPATRLIVRDYMAPLRKGEVDTLLLGCTHYPLLKKIIQEEVGEAVRLVDSSASCADEVARLLQTRGIAQERGVGSHTFFATDDPEKFSRLGSRFLQRALPPAHLLELNKIFVV